MKKDNNINGIREGDRVWFKDPSSFSSIITHSRNLGWNGTPLVVVRTSSYDGLCLVTLVFPNAGSNATVDCSKLVKVYVDEDNTLIVQDKPLTGHPEDPLDSYPASRTEVKGEAVKPQYYQFKIRGIEVDVFDIARGMSLPFTLASALKYFRVKGDKAKQINDLEKAVECIRREIEHLKLS
jgi:hypothetical protein